MKTYKKIITICFLSILLFNNYRISSQTYNPIIDTNKIWKNVDLYYYLVFGGQIKYDFIKFSGDTIINSILYNKAWISYDTNQTNWTLQGFMREDLLGKVYYITNYNLDTVSVESIIYDFGLNVNDSIQLSNDNHCIGSDWLKVIQVDSVLIYDSFRKRMFVSNYDGYTHSTEFWIEGIGSSYGLLFPNYQCVGGMPYLLCYHENDTLKYENPNYLNCSVSTYLQKFNNQIKIYPNPASNIINISGLNENANFELYNMLGEIVCNQDLCNEFSKIYINKSIKKGLYYYKLIKKDELISSGKIVLN